MIFIFSIRCDFTQNNNYINYELTTIFNKKLKVITNETTFFMTELME